MRVVLRIAASVAMTGQMVVAEFYSGCLIDKTIAICG
jgi:hypothetical protein